jgi:hypothetical protein
LVKPETAVVYLSQLKKREELYRKFYKKEKISIKVF